jgi:hypothetical protein
MVYGLACDLPVLGLGSLLGGSVNNILIFIMEDDILNQSSKNSNMKIGTQSEITLGPLDLAFQFDISAGKGGLGSTAYVLLLVNLFLLVLS